MGSRPAPKGYRLASMKAAQKDLGGHKETFQNHFLRLQDDTSHPTFRNPHSTLHN